MKLSDLKTGMWVKFRNGYKAIVLKDYETKNHGIGLFAFEDGISFYSDYDENLKILSKNRYDIVEVFIPQSDCLILDKENLISIWKRKEKPVLPKKLKSFFEMLSPEYKKGWIAKDKDGEVYIYQNKPKKKNGSWMCEHSNVCDNIDRLIDKSFIDWLSWEDEEPWHIPDLMEEE